MKMLLPGSPVTESEKDGALEALEQALPPMWRDGELRVFDRAVSLLAEALQAEDGLAPFRAAEQLANFEDRLIASQLEGKSVTKEILVRWQAVQKRIEQLIEIAGPRERWSRFHRQIARPQKIGRTEAEKGDCSASRNSNLNRERKINA